MLIDRRFFSYFDYLLMGVAILIPCLSLIVLYSAGFDEETSRFIFNIEIKSQAFLKQMIFLFVGIGCVLVGLCLPAQFLSRCSWFLYGLCLTLLLAVDVVGRVVKGSQRWLSIGGLNIQPAELTKLAVILAMARILSRMPPPPGGYRLRDLVLLTPIFVVPAALIMAQPDLGTAMVVMAVGFCMLMFMGIRTKAIVVLLVPVLLALYPAWHSLHDYQKRRVLVLMDPEIDPKGSGYHITQSKIAVGSGALFGKGFMQGTQTQLQFLPEHTTDFIFSVLGEEWGFAGCMSVILLYLFFLFRLLRITSRSRDLFSAMVILGITSLFYVHTIINIGMVIGLLPVVGLPLPLFSYGGSSLVSSMLSLGIVLGLDMRRLLFLTK